MQYIILFTTGQYQLLNDIMSVKAILLDDKDKRVVGIYEAKELGFKVVNDIEFIKTECARSCT